MFIITLSDFLVQYRQEHGLSQRQFASLCGLSNGYISMLEKNINPSTGKPVVPTLVALSKLSACVGISLDELFSVVDDMPVSLAVRQSAPLTASALSPVESSLVSAWRLADDKARRKVAIDLEDYGFSYDEDTSEESSRPILHLAARGGDSVPLTLEPDHSRIQEALRETPSETE